MKKIALLKLLFLFVVTSSPLFAAERTVNLVVGYKNVNFAGVVRQAITVNDQIPAPTLHFKQGDHVTIHVHNTLDKETAIHWHGLIVPWQMDGVAGISQKGIPPGGAFTYRFTLRQAGTYWYHAHFGAQEQQGLYGAFLIDPPSSPHYRYTKDFVIVLSDWSNTAPEQIFANLKKEGDYYSPRFPLQPSLMRFIHDYKNATPEEKKQLIDDYAMMQQMRMSIYDLSDVAYDAFLLNGHPNAHPWKATVKPGDIVRLRFIGASASTNFRVKITNSLMNMVQIQGNDVRRHYISDFKITPGETYDVLVKITKDSPYIIYAESADTTGVAYGALVTSPYQVVDYKNVPSFPTPLPVTREMMGGMMHGMHHHGSMMMPSMDESKTTGTKYQHLKAAVTTNNPNKPIESVIHMKLYGYMGRFMWFINGVAEHDAKPIRIQPRKRYRIIFTNDSMMHHPMHLHGHWFILRLDHGAYDPLLHTIDVAPGATVIADFDTDTNGQWLFHCHHLYHMLSGMGRVFQYTTLLELSQYNEKPTREIKPARFINRPIVRVDSLPIDFSLIKHPMPHEHPLSFANFLDIGADPFHGAQKLTFKGLYGRDENKLELFTNDAEMDHGIIENADMDIFYWHLIDEFWAIKAGVNYFYRPSQVPYWQSGIGIEGLMPYFIDTDIRAYYHKGSVKLDAELSRATQITNNFFVKIGLRGILATQSVLEDEISSGLNQARFIVMPYYRLAPGLNLFAEYEHQKNYNTLIKDSANTFTFGISVIF